MSSPETLETRKTALRKQIRAALAASTPAQQTADSDAMRTRLTQHSAWQKARSVLLFAPLAGEPDLWPLLATALQQGKTVALPAFDPVTGVYQARQIQDSANDIVSGQYGIREPHSFCPPHPLNGLDLALVPGIGFDLHGRRLGRGKGYYDRLLTSVNGLKCGVAFDAQIVAEIPTQPHDIRLNCILTPTRWIET